MFSDRFLFCFAVLCVVSSFEMTLLRRGELITLLLLCSECYVALALPLGSMDWSVVCNCGNSWLYSLFDGK